jgi:broad specificity phosphatase PhoE
MRNARRRCAKNRRCAMHINRIDSEHDEMGELVLIRHGQASFGTDDYDRLSPLGFEQAQWLGKYFAARGIGFQRVISGTLRRHLETLRGIDASVEPELMPSLNEFDFFGLVKIFLQQNPEYGPVDFGNVREFFLALRKALPLWSEGGIENPPESWDSFQTRIRDSLTALMTTDVERVLVVSSGGPISALLREVLQLSVRNMMDINLQTANTSITRLHFKNGKARLQSFNGIPHLDTPATSHLITLT